MSDVEQQLEQIIELASEAMYERGRRLVSGRPRWDRLNPNEPYEMGMKQAAREMALGHAMLDPVELCRLAKIGLAHDGWVEWSGRGKPVFDDDRVFVRNRSGNEFAALGGAVRWSHDGRAHDIIAYRIALPTSDGAKT